MKGHQTILRPHCLLLCDSFAGITKGHQHQKRELCLNKLVTWRDLHNCYIWRNFEYAVLPGMLQLAGRFQPWCSWSFLILTFYPRLTWWWLSPQVRYVKWNGIENIETSLLFGICWYAVFYKLAWRSQPWVKTESGFPQDHTDDLKFGLDYYAGIMPSWSSRVLGGTKSKGLAQK